MMDVERISEILHNSGDVPETIKVISFESKLLAGGCHFKAMKLSLTYSEFNEKLPRSIVFRNARWNKTFLEKVLLYCKKSLNFIDKKTIKLRSYEIETNFYKLYSNDIKGLKLPKVYYIHENGFQNEFQMVMEDLSNYYHGQSSGFSFDDSMICLKQLALFHIQNWDNPIAKPGIQLWNIGGYWTDGKEANKSDFRKCWNVVIENFRDELQLSESLVNLGYVLESRLNETTILFNNLKPRTIIHGDYRTSNIFIDHQSTENQVYAIDWQWCGFGHAAMDIVHFLVASVHENAIENLFELVRFYHKVLTDNGISYSWELFWKAYQICWIELFIYLVIAFWSDMQAKDVELYRKEGTHGLYATSYVHMKYLFTQTEIFMKDLETSSLFQSTVSCFKNKTH